MKKELIISVVVLMMVLLSSCGENNQPVKKSEVKREVESKTDKQSSIDSDKQVYIGKLVKNEAVSDIIPGQYCCGDTLYKGALYRVGRMNIFLNEEPDAEMFGKTVAVYGSRKTSLADKVKLLGTCSDATPWPIQFRSDWGADEGGYRNSIDRLKKSPYIEADTIVPFNLVTIVKTDADSLTITIQNPMADTLKDVNLVVHYEGGKKKTEARYLTKQVTLIPGQKMTFGSIPAILGGELSNKRNWKFRSSFLLGKSGNVELGGSPYYKPSDIVDMEEIQH